MKDKSTKKSSPKKVSGVRISTKKISKKSKEFGDFNPFPFLEQKPNCDEFAWVPGREMPMVASGWNPKVNTISPPECMMKPSGIKLNIPVFYRGGWKGSGHGDLSLRQCISIDPKDMDFFGENYSYCTIYPGEEIPEYVAKLLKKAKERGYF
jgi:hypothetical protein